MDSEALSSRAEGVGRNEGIMIGVGAIIEDETGRILLVKHKPKEGDFWYGKWICPGGELEVGETIEEGIIREVREETNLEIALTKALTPFDRVVKGDSRVSLHVLYIDYLARLVGGELRTGDDVGEARWVSKEELPQIWEELHEDTRRLLRIAELI